MHFIYDFIKHGSYQPNNIKDINFIKFNGFTDSATRQLELRWNLEIKKCKNPNLLKILIKTFGIWPLIVGVIYSTIEIASHVQIPLYVGYIVSHFGTNVDGVPVEDLYRHLMSLVAFSLLSGSLSTTLKMYATRVGIKMRVACSTLIYQKSLNVSDHNISGLILCLLTDDVHNLDNFFIGIHRMWKIPLETFILLYMMYLEVGVPAIYGMLAMLTVIPIHTVVVRLINDCEMHLERATDKRVHFIEQMIKGINVIKSYTWENLFYKTVEKLREREINIISQRSFLITILYSLNILPRVAVFLILTTFSFNGNLLSLRYVFVISLCYQMLKISIIQKFPKSLAESVQAINSIYRIQNFLLKSNDHKNRISDLLKNRMPNMNSLRKGIILDNVSASWKQNETIGIQSIDLNLRADRTYGITGKTGSGKSCLLHTIIQELEPNEGSVEINGTISYASQEPLIFNNTIKENILFGAEYDQNRYKNVCQLSTLDRDWEMFKLRDETQIEKNAESLSDDLKSKIDLARAIYREADIYLIDNPICFDNCQTGSYIFENCFQKFLKGKCVVFVTNETKYLSMMDQVITMENGRIKEIGKFNRILYDETYSSVENRVIPDRQPSYIELHEVTDDSKFNKSGLLSIIQNRFGSLVNNKLLGIAIALILCTQMLMSGIDFFVSEWANLQANTTSRLELTSNATSENEFKAKPYLYMYTILILVLGYLLYHRTISFFRLCLDNARTMHNKLTYSILSAPLQFFADSSFENLTQCFYYDMKNIDLYLPKDLLDFLTILAEAVFVVVFVVSANCVLIIPSLVLVMLFYGIRRLFINSLRHLAKIEAINVKNITIHVNSSLHGGTTIRVFNTKNQFIDQFYKYQDNSVTITYLNNLMLSLFNIGIEMFCCFYLIMIILSIFLLDSSDNTGSSVGLAITQVLILNSICARGMNKSFDIETQLSSVTNILNYCEGEFESSAMSTDIIPSNYKWPKHGQIAFKNVHLKNSSNLLNRINFEIKAKEKISILGLEKSLVLNAMFRFDQLECGSIKIDGFDIQKINLNKLRKNISIITHDHPFIFAGTVRYNLDPLNNKSDTEIIDLLRQIESEIDSNSVIINFQNTAENLNLKEKQIVCLVRALLTQNNIIIVDEVAENIDDTFRKIVHRIIEKVCTDCTVIILANQIHCALINCDRIMIFHEGRLVEYDHPYKIIKNCNKYFELFLENYDEKQRSELINIAKDNYKL